MEFLLDTHIILWTLFKPYNLSQKAISVLSNKENEFYYSIASMWEVAIKHIRHPDDIPMSEFEYANFCKLSGFKLLPLKVEHVLTLSTIKKPENVSKKKEHKDPFDHIMVINHNLSNKFSFYNFLRRY